MILCAAAACHAPPNPGPAPTDGAALALVGGTLYSAPDAPPIADAALVIEGERIVAVGPRARVRIPRGAVVLDLRGHTLLPAFWNNHVHLAEPKWMGIDTMRADRAADLLRSMFTRFGFVHVFDIGSFSEVALKLRERIERDDVVGPNILTTLLPFVPPNGTPRYVAPVKLPELHTPSAARDSVRARIAAGANAIKLFTVPITRAEPYPVMPPAVVQAVTAEAHAAGRLVFAHPTNHTGVQVAAGAGVDILAHTVPIAGDLPAALWDSITRRQIALVPTLMLWEEELGADTVGRRQFILASQSQLRAYAARGGRLLFGTDVGYITRYDPTREYELMAGAGLDFPAILASLTTTPADVFGRSNRTGRLALGYDADVVVVDGDPNRDIRALGRVRLTLKRGSTVFTAGKDQ